MLYGFTATDFGKQDAVTKSRRFLNDNSIAISNGIKVCAARVEYSAEASGSPTEAAGVAGSSADYSDQDANPAPAASSPNPDAASMRNQSQRDLPSYAAQQAGPPQTQPGVGGSASSFNFGNSGMGLGALLGMGGAGMGVSGGGLDGLLGLLSGAGGYPSYGSGPSRGYGSSPQSGYGPPPVMVRRPAMVPAFSPPAAMDRPPTRPPGYPGYGYPSGGLYRPGGGP